MNLKVGIFLRYKVAGYFSVEAALVFPLVIGTILLLMYLGFYQYDRCMLEFDVAAIALAGCVCEEEKREAVLDEMQQAAGELSEEKYIAWEAEEIYIEMNGNRVRASGGGNLFFTFGFLLQKRMNSLWETEVYYENMRLDPVAFVRGYKKIAGGE